MNNLQQVFSKFSNKNKEVLICLDETFCFARSPETKPKNCISITSIMDKEDVYECLKEEGSAIINFKLTNKGVNKNLNINKILNSFVSSLVEFNFEPFIVTLLSTEVIISVVISDKDIGFVNDDIELDYDSSVQGGEEDKYGEDDDDDKECEDDVEDKGDEDVEDDDDDKDDYNEGEDVEDDYNQGEDDDDGKDKGVEDVEDDEDDNGVEDVEDDEDKGVECEEDKGKGVECEEKGVKHEEVMGDDSCHVINSEGEDDSIDGNTEDDHIKKEIRNELNNMNIDKLKKNDFISFLKRFNIKNINGKNTRHCNKKELHCFLIEKLEN